MIEDTETVIKQENYVANENNDERLLWLDGARGLCALSVVVYHLFAWEYDAVFDSAGLLSVYTFFTLSAVSLCYVYNKIFFLSVGKLDAFKFYKNRVARIIPLLFLVSSLYFVAGLLKGGFNYPDLSAYFITASGFFFLAPPGFVSNATGAWTIGIELIFYMFFPVIFLISSSATLKSLVISAVLLSVLQGCYVSYVYSATDPSTFWSVYITPLSFCGFFAWGFVAARSGRGRLLSAKWALLGITVLVMMVWHSLFLDITRYTMLTFPGSLVTTALIGLAIIVLFKCKNYGVLDRLNKNLGEISYGSYLVHPFIIKGLSFFVPSGFFSPSAHVAVVLILTAAASKIIFLYFENPARRIIRNYQARSEVSR